MLVVLSTLLTSSAQILYKIGANRLPELWTNWPLILGFVVYCFAALLIIIALKFVDMSVVFPALSTSFVWVSLFSVLFFKEVLSMINWFGVAIIVLGVSILSMGEV